MHHFRVLEYLKVNTGAPSKDEPARSPTPTRKNDRDEKQETNISNEWRIYAKMEGNYHLTNKYALFFNMSKYYKSMGRDPFDVLPLSYHIKSGTSDMTFFKFMQSFKEFEEKAILENGKEEEIFSSSVLCKREIEKNLCLKCECELEEAKTKREIARNTSKKGFQSSPVRTRIAGKERERLERVEEKKASLQACLNDKKNIQKNIIPAGVSRLNTMSCQNCGSMFNEDERRKETMSPSQQKRRTSLSRRGTQVRAGLPNAFGKSRFSNNNNFDNQN